MIVRVTKLDIQRGKRFKPRACAIARAFNRIGHYKKKIEVAGNVTFGKRIYLLPQSAEAFIRAFDSQGMVQPFTFRAKRSKGSN